MQPFLAESGIIDFRRSEIADLAKELSTGSPSNLETARGCFEWVRDQVAHSGDTQRNPITCRASDVLKHRTGMCYAKSHLLAALLRANGIPTAFCYQRMKLDDAGDRWCLHGLNAVFLDGIGWYRIDPRGNKPGVNAQFHPPVEALAYPAGPGDVQDLDGLHAEPLDVVVKSLQSHPDLASLLENLPDIGEGDE
jgi:transglutaminase-like putative cysteine protease